MENKTNTETKKKKIEGQKLKKKLNYKNKKKYLSKKKN